MADIHRLHATETMTTRQALTHALACEQEESMDQVLICGHYADDDFFVFSSRMTRKDALWLSEKMRNWALYGNPDD